MKIDYKAHYDEAYFTGRKQYRAANGELALYHGPSLTWEGFQRISDLLASLMPGKSLLDIGCGGGDLAARFLKKGYDAYGVDISQYAVDNCVPEMRGRLVVADISTRPALAPLPDKYDVVLATDLLEHIYQEDLDTTFNWMVERSKLWLFFLVATVHDPNNPSTYATPEEFIQRKGEEIPLRWQPTAVSGHVHVRKSSFWANYFTGFGGLKIRWDLMYLFQTMREADHGLRNTWGWCMPNTYILERVVNK